VIAAKLAILSKQEALNIATVTSAMETCSSASPVALRALESEERKEKPEDC
jgi:hypothetical protein